MTEAATVDRMDVPLAPALAAEPAQPKSGLLWLCKCCGDALVARGAYDSGYCTGCRTDVVAGAAQ